VQDQNGESDSAMVSVNVIPNFVRISLSVTNSQGTKLTSLTVGDTFLLQGIVEDLRDVNPTGVFAAYLDVDYMADLATITGPISYGADYPNQRSGDIIVDGLIDEIGAFANQDRVGSGPKKLFSVPMKANAAGVLTFRASPADGPKNDVHLFDIDNQIPDNRIEYVGANVNIKVTPDKLITNTNLINPLDVDGNGSVTPFDALQIINELNAKVTVVQAGRFTDVNADGVLSPGDALMVINYLNNLTKARAGAVAAIAANPTEDSPAKPKAVDPMQLSDDLVRRRELDLAQVADAIFHQMNDENREVEADELDDLFV
jgi:hypothetical protein